MFDQYKSRQLNCFLSPTSTRSGYGALQYHVFNSMVNELGVDLKPINPSVYLANPHDSPTWYQGFVNNNYSSEKIRMFSNCLSINYPTCFGAIEGQRSYAFTMFENELLPKYLVDCINRQDVAIVPCDQNIHSFKNSGVVIPVYKVHLGNDQNEYHFLDRNWHISDSNPFTFLIIGATNWRKGYDLAIKAFKKVFPGSQKDVRLIVKVSKQYTAPWAIPGMKTTDERIVLVKNELTEKEMLNLYGMGHCYVGPSRGDAWNLLAFQALATGMPAITTNYCGPEEYQHLTFPLNWAYQYCDTKVLGQDWGTYGEPDFDHLCELMEHAYKNPEVCRTKGINASNEIRENFTWKHTAKHLLDVIEMTS